MAEEYINFSQKNGTGIVKLNRPKALNALNYDMAEIFLKKLNEWDLENSIKRILVYQTNVIYHLCKVGIEEVQECYLGELHVLLHPYQIVYR